MRPLFSLCINAALIVLRHERGVVTSRSGARLIGRWRITRDGGGLSRQGGRVDDGHHGLMLEGVARCRARPARKSNVRSRLGLGGSGGTVQAPPRGGRRLVSLTGACDTCQFRTNYNLSAVELTLAH